MGILLGFVGIGLIWWIVRGATAGVPNKRQAFVELLFDFVDEQVKGIFHGERNFVAPAALTVFVWVLLMNAMDFLPGGYRRLGLRTTFRQHDFRIVPTADVNTTFALALSVWLLMIYSASRSRARRLDPRTVLRAVRLAPAAVAVQLPVQPGRVSSPSRCRTRCGCSATCMRARSFSCCCGCGPRPGWAAPFSARCSGSAGRSSTS